MILLAAAGVLLLVVPRSHSAPTITAGFTRHDGQGNKITAGGVQALQFTVNLPDGRVPAFHHGTRTSSGQQQHSYSWRIAWLTGRAHCYASIYYQWHTWYLLDSSNNIWHNPAPADATLKQSPVVGKYNYDDSIWGGHPTGNHFCLEVRHSADDGSDIRTSYFAYTLERDAPSASLTADKTSVVLDASDSPYGIERFFYYLMAADAAADDQCPDQRGSYTALELVEGETDDHLAGEVVIEDVSPTRKKATAVFQDGLNGRYVCFAVVDAQWNAAFFGRTSRRMVALLPPVLTASTAADRESAVITAGLDPGNLIADAGIDGSTWRYNAASCESTRNAASPDWRPLDSAGFGLGDPADPLEASLNFAAAELEDSAGLCFSIEVVSARGNRFGFLDYAVPDRPPRLSASQRGNVITISASNAGDIPAASWLYIDSAAGDGSDCNAAGEAGFGDWSGLSVAGRGGSASLDLDDLAAGQTAAKCFKATDNAGQTGYLAYTPTYTPPDTIAPAIRISQNRSRLTATATDASGIDASSWYYVVSARRPVCDADAFIDRPAESGRRVSLSRSQIGRYLCFEVGDNAGNYGYRSYRVAHWLLSRPPADTAPPPIAITQTETRLTASTEADDADSGSWRNLRIHDGHCDRESFGGDFEESPVVDLARLAAGDYAWCFAVRDTSGNWSYAALEFAIAPEAAVEPEDIALQAEPETFPEPWPEPIRTTGLQAPPSGSDGTAIPPLPDNWQTLSDHQKLVWLLVNNDNRYKCPDTTKLDHEGRCLGNGSAPAGEAENVPVSPVRTADPETERPPAPEPETEPEAAPDPEPETEPPAESQSSSRFVLSLAGAVVLGGLILAVAAFGARKRKSPGPPA